MPITLPYPSLKLEDIYAYNSTILVRSENKIYKSSDDGDNWKIVFESDTKVRQLYSLDAHTIFVVGDSGMAYRTFDYGESWEDITFETKENFTAIAAKDYEDYLLLSEQAYIFHKGGEERELVTIRSNSIAPFYSVIYFNENYYFGGGVKKQRYVDFGKDVIEFEMPYYIYKEQKIFSTSAMFLRIVDEGRSDTDSDSLKMFPTDLGIYYTAVNKGVAFAIPNIDSDDSYGLWEAAIKIKNDKVIYIDNVANKINIFNKSGKWITLNSDDPIYNDYTRYENQNLGITPINSMFRTDTNAIIIASNNSMIYKVKINEAITGIEDNTKSGVKIFGNILVLDDNANLLSVYNYMGITVNYEILSEKVYRLPMGLNFISYTRKDKITTTKVSVVE